MLRRVCVFGTSADPPTGPLGHAGIVSHLASLSSFDKVLVVPVYRHMFREKRERGARNSDTYRDANSEEEGNRFERKMEMCRLQFEKETDSKETKRAVTVVALERAIYEKKLSLLPPSPSPSLVASVRVGTLDLLLHLQSLHPAAELSLCLGADSYADLCAGKWRGAKEITRLLQGRVHVIERPFEEPATGEAAKETAASLVARQNSAAAAAAATSSSSSPPPPHPATLHVVPTLGPVSSSQARQCTTVEALERIVGSKVAEYIVREKLFGFKEATLID